MHFVLFFFFLFFYFLTKKTRLETAGTPEVSPQNGTLPTKLDLSGSVFFLGDGSYLQFTLRLTCAESFLTSPCRPFVNIYFIHSEYIL